MKIRINPGAVLFWGVLFLTVKRSFFPILFATAFHEAGHLCAARLLRLRMRCLELDLFGAKLYPAGPLPSYGAEWFLAAGGPIFSILLVLFSLPFSGEFASAIRAVSASFALFNLFPVAGFDGGRMTYSFLAAKLPIRIADGVLAAGTYLSLLFFFCLSACLLLRYGQNLALLILSASLFARIFLPVA